MLYPVEKQRVRGVLNMQGARAVPVSQRYDSFSGGDVFCPNGCYPSTLETFIVHVGSEVLGTKDRVENEDKKEITSLLKYPTPMQRLNEKAFTDKANFDSSVERLSVLIVKSSAYELLKEFIPDPFLFKKLVGKIDVLLRENDDKSGLETFHRNLNPIFLEGKYLLGYLGRDFFLNDKANTHELLTRAIYKVAREEDLDAVRYFIKLSAKLFDEQQFQEHIKVAFQALVLEASVASRNKFIRFLLRLIFKLTGLSFTSRRDQRIILGMTYILQDLGNDEKLGLVIRGLRSLEDNGYKDASLVKWVVQRLYIRSILIGLDAPFMRGLLRESCGSNEQEYNLRAMSSLEICLEICFDRHLFKTTYTHAEGFKKMGRAKEVIPILLEEAFFIQRESGQECFFENYVKDIKEAIRTIGSTSSHFDDKEVSALKEEFADEMTEGRGGRDLTASVCAFIDSTTRRIINESF